MRVIRGASHHGYESTEERSPGGYTHGWNSPGHAWTITMAKEKPEGSRTQYGCP
jgi:hypothetical protein